MDDDIPTDADLGIAPRALRSKAGGDQSPSDADLGIGPSPDAGPLANTHDEGWLSGAAKGTGTAVIKGLANVPGQIKNYGNLVDYLMARGHAAITGRPLEEVQRDLQQRQAAADQGLGGWVGKTNPANVLPSGEDIAAPILKKTGEYEPSTNWGKYGMAGVETATSMIGPGGGARVVNAPVSATRVVPRIVETAVKPAIKAAPLNAAAGAGAQAATDLTGDPLYGMAVGLGVGAAGEGALKTVKTIAKPFAQDIPGAGRMFAGTREAEVGKQILAASENPQEVERKLFPGPMRPGDTLSTEAIPGSQPTLAQWVGRDQGLNNAEMAARNEAGAAGPNDPFATVDKAQNAARLQALEQGAPAGADTMKPSEAFQAHLDHIDQSTEQAVNQLTQNAQAAAPKGTQKPEDVGGTLRTAIENAKAAAKELRNQAYRAIDPDGTLNVVATPVYQAAQKVANSISQWGEIKNADLKRILPKMQEAPDVMQFKHLQDLEEDVTGAMSDERRQKGETADWRRLTQLKGALRDTINNAVDNQAKYRPEQTLEGYLKELWGDYPNAGSATITVGGTRNSSEVVPGGTATYGASSDGAGTAATGRSQSATNDQGVSPEPLQPNFDAGAIDRVNTAKAAATEYGRTYKSEPVAGALKGPFKGQYSKPAGALPGEAFAKGDKGYEATGAFLKAANDSPEAVAALKDHARSDLADAAVRKDGTLDPVKYNKWRSDHDGALRAIEERSPGFTGEFSTASRATDQMLAAQAARKQQLGDFQKSQAGAFLGKQTPTEVENTIGQILKTKDLASIGELIKQASTDPAALDGLRKAGIDWMAREFTDASSDRWMKSAKFRDFVNKRYDALAKLYGSDQANMFRAIADDLASADQPSKATAPKRGPGTAKDVAPLLKKAVEAAKHPSLFNAMAVGAMGGFEAHGLRGGLYGAGAAGAAYAIGSLRAAGVKTMQDMFRDALSNPERARYYVSKVQPKEHALSAVTRSLRRELLLSKPIGADEPVGRASGGRVNIRDYPAKKASHIEKQMNRICKAYGGELNPMLGMSDDTVARALRVANRGGFADGGRVTPEEGTMEGPTLNPFGIDPDRVRQITGLLSASPPAIGFGFPAGVVGGRIAQNAVEPAVESASRLGEGSMAGIIPGARPLTTDEAIPRSFEAASALAGVGLPMAEAGAAGIFGGKLTRDPAGFAKLGEGKDMLTAGVNPRDTYLQSGAWKGPEGMMRYEIPDYNATLKTGAESAINTGKSFAGKLKDFVDHPEFFKAYPDLADTAVLFYPSRTSHHGYFAPGSNFIKLYGNDPAQVQSTLLHEMQHAVQNKEGFTPGWSTEEATNEASALLSKAEDLGMPRNQRLAFWNRFDPYDAYRRAAGEVEARAVQARAGLTPEQASIFSPDLYMTAQAPRSKWIVRRR